MTNTELTEKLINKLYAHRYLAIGSFTIEYRREVRKWELMSGKGHVGLYDSAASAVHAMQSLDAAAAQSPPQPMTIQISNCDIEWDSTRGVLYVHSSRGTTLIRICHLPVCEPDTVTWPSHGLLDIIADKKHTALPLGQPEPLE